ncbi:hypothetical protein HDE_02635 [Halotydeus destructor]|nr:hypothetical protein HDE_02635 [Halotydeus destructor]
MSKRKATIEEIAKRLRKDPIIQVTELRRRTATSRKFRASQETVFFRVTPNIPDNIGIEQLLEAIKNAIWSMVQTSVTSSVKQDDQIRIALSNAKHNTNVNLPFMRYGNMTVDDVFHHIKRFAQSKRAFFADGDLTVDVIHVNMPSGGGYAKRKNTIIDFRTWMHNSQRVIQVEGDGNCCARAICVAKARLDQISDWKQVCRKKSLKQTAAASRLQRKANVDISSGECGYEALKRYQDTLGSNYQLLVVAAATPNTFLFKGPPAELPENQVCIIYNEGHYDALISIRAYLQCSYWCPKCCVGYNDKRKHNCVGRCDCCFSNIVCEAAAKLHCQSCNRDFNGETCFENHKTNNICNTMFRCKGCKKLIKSAKLLHKCNHFKCRTCKLTVPYGNHECFVEPRDLAELHQQDMEPRIYLFYDFEAAQQEADNGRKLHVVDLVFALTVCDKCWIPVRKTRDINCQSCGSMSKLIHGVDTVQSFCDWVFNDVEQFCRGIEKKSSKPNSRVIKVYCVAHNAKSYDCQFVLRKMLEQRRVPKIIKNGSKILLMEAGRFRFIDSLNFLPMPLSSFAKSFSLPQHKDFFPHDYHTLDKLYIGPTTWPAKGYYNTDRMSFKEKQDFDEWYEQQKEKPFDILKEMDFYCRKDVEVLMSGFMCFRDIFRSITELDPTTRQITVSGAVMEAYRAKYLKPKTIAVTPIHGYEPKRIQSYIACVWLDYMETQVHQSIRREVKVGPYFADGILKESLRPLNNETVKVTYYNGVPSLTVMDQIRPQVIVLDDLMSKMAGQHELFTQVSHHKNISIVFIAQNTFYKGLHDITQNIHYFVIMKNPRDASKLDYLARQTSMDAKKIRAAYQSATADPFSYLLLDFYPDTPDALRIRSRILPSELSDSIRRLFGSLPYIY